MGFANLVWPIGVETYVDARSVLGLRKVDLVIFNACEHVRHVHVARCLQQSSFVDKPSMKLQSWCGQLDCSALRLAKSCDRLQSAVSMHVMANALLMVSHDKTS